MATPEEIELLNLSEEEQESLDMYQKLLLARLRVNRKLDERDRYRKALEEILTEVKSGRQTATGRKAYIRSVCEAALGREWEDDGPQS